MAGRNLTQRIEILESHASSVASRLDVHDTLIKGLSTLLDKGAIVADGHSSKIVVIEKELIVLAGMKDVKTALAQLEKDSLGMKKDIESLIKWKEDLKKEKEETVKRFWSFGPNLVAAFVSGIITLLGIGVTVALNYWLLRR